LPLGNIVTTDTGQLPKQGPWEIEISLMLRILELFPLPEVTSTRLQSTLEIIN
jgi:hypothetical protein